MVLASPQSLVTLNECLLSWKKKKEMRKKQVLAVAVEWVTLQSDGGPSIPTSLG